MTPETGYKITPAIDQSGSPADSACAETTAQGRA